MTRAVLSKLATLLIVLLIGAAPLLFGGRAAFAGRPAADTDPAGGPPSRLLQATAGGHVLGFTASGAYLATAGHALHVTFVDGRPVEPRASGHAATAARVQPLQRVSWSDLWEGVSLTYLAVAGGVAESVYRLAPRTPVNRIRLRYNAPIQLQPDGSLSMSFADGNMLESAPVGWQEIGGQRVPVAVSFRLHEDNELGFALGAYDPAYPVTIDPTYSWDRFLGGTSNDIAYAVALDAGGNVYVAGDTGAIWGSPVRAFAGSQDAFVARLSADGDLQWNTFLGSSGDDQATGIALDGSGNVYVAGFSAGAWGSPVQSYSGGLDAFVARLDGSGALKWNTFLGGAANDSAHSLAVDAGGNIYVDGTSYATWGSPILPFAGAEDVFVARLNSAGGRQWSMFLGGTGTDVAGGIAVYGTLLYVAGASAGTWGTPHAGYAYHGATDAFLARITAAGTLQWSIFLGGTDSEGATSVTTDPSGAIYVLGFGTGTWGDPVHKYSGAEDTFVAKVNYAGELQWNTFLGGPGTDHAKGIEALLGGVIYVTGWSTETWGSTPLQAGDRGYLAMLDGSGSMQWHTFLGDSANGLLAYSDAMAALPDASYVYVAGQSDSTWGSPVHPYAGGADVLVAKYDFHGARQWHTFLGATITDASAGIAVDPDGYIYVTGTSNGGWGSPIRAYSGGSDAFVARLDQAGSTTWVTFLGGAGTDVGTAVTADDLGHSYVVGTSNTSWGAPKRPKSSGNDVFAALLNSDGSLAWHTFLGGTGTDSAAGVAQAFHSWYYVLGTSTVGWGAPLHGHSGGVDTFVAKLSAGTGLITWSTFLGGGGDDSAGAITLSNGGDPFVAGTSNATWSAAAGSPRTGYHAGRDAYVAKLNSNGAPQWNTFLGGSGDQTGQAIDLDATAAVYVAGNSNASWGSPLRPYAGSWDVFVAMLKPNGDPLWHTFLGGAGSDAAMGLAVDGDYDVYVTGYSFASWGDPRRAFAARDDALVARLKADGTLQWNTFLGGQGYDAGAGITSDAAGHLFVAGWSDQAWSQTGDTYGAQFHGGSDAFVSAVNYVDTPTPTATATKTPTPTLTPTPTSTPTATRTATPDYQEQGYLPLLVK